MERLTVSSILSVFDELLPKDISIAVSDSRQFIYYQPSGGIDLKIRPGDELKKGTLSFKALSIKQKVSQYVKSDVFGVPYYGMSVPLLNEGDPQGCITAILPAKHANETYLRKTPSFITIKNEDRWLPISYEKIMYVEALNGKTIVHTNGGEGTHRYTLSELEYTLPTDRFIRCHRSYIVNLDYIEEIQPDFHSTFILVLRDEVRTRIPVSQSYSSYFRKLLGF